MDIKNLLKPTNAKLKFILIQLVSCISLWAILLLFSLFLQSSLGFAHVNVAGETLLFAAISTLFPVAVAIYIFVALLSLPEVLDWVLGICVWWLLTCVLYELSSFVWRKGIKKTIAIIVLLLLVVAIIYAASIFSKYGLEIDRGGCEIGFGTFCSYEVVGISKISFDNCYEHPEKQCIRVCPNGDIAYSIKNNGAYPIVLETVRVTDSSGQSCSRSFEKPMNSGEKVSIAIREGCPTPHTSYGASPPTLHEDLSIEVTYTQNIEGRDVQATEKGTVMAQPVECIKVL